MSALTRWDPFRGLMSMQSELDRMMEDFFGRRAAPRDAVRLPAVDISESDNEVIVTAEMPGVEKKDVQVEVMSDSVSLSAELAHEKEEKGETFHRRERVWRRYERSIPLPAEVVTEQVKAAMRDGVLEIRLPKTERSTAATPRKVTVE